MKLIPPERPRGEVVRAMRERQLVDRRTMTQEEFGSYLDCTKQQIADYEAEKKGARMPAATWRLARITFDVRFFALFQRELHHLRGTRT